MKHILLTAGLLAAALSSYAQVGIGTSSPKAFFNVPVGRTVLFGKDTVASSIGGFAALYEPRFIWYGAKGAFRAGGVNLGGPFFGPSDTWNIENVGNYSFASGVATTASGQYSTALGLFTSARANASTALGHGSQADGSFSTAMGHYTTADGEFSTAAGTNSKATGSASVAMGYYSNALGDNSIAMGKFATATGINSWTMGYATSVPADNAMGLGSNVYVINKGSFVFGDASNDVVSQSTQDNQMMMRFAGGYTLYTVGGTQSQAVGVQIQPGGNAWQTISDSTRKENFRTADGASFLKKISQMRLGSWNYKGQDARQYRHYGPMAQDFYAAFGKDEVGTIGEDKSINQADFDGVNLIAIKALIEEVNQLKAENAKLRATNENLQKETASLQSDMDWVKKQLRGFAKH